MIIYRSSRHEEEVDLDLQLQFRCKKCEEICRDSRRFKALSAAQATLLKAFKEALGKYKKTLTVYDLFFNLDDSWNEKMILTVLRVLVKKRILEEEVIKIQDRKISVFRLR